MKYRTSQGCIVTTIHAITPDGQPVEHVILESEPLRLAEEPKTGKNIYDTESARFR